MILKNFRSLETILSKYWVVVLVILSLPVIWALFIPGFFGASDDLHIAWLYEMDKTIKSGQIPPRYVPDLSFGYGYPLFNFVYPLPFYIGEIFHLLSLNFVDSIKAVFLSSTILSGIFMFLLLKQFMSKSLSLLGSLMYLYAPYRAVDLYIRGAIGEIVAFVFLPLVILSVIKITDEETKAWIKWICIGGLSFAGLMLSHNIATLMFMPFIVLLGIIRIIVLQKKPWKVLLKFIGTLVLGLVISIYFWLPALLDSKLMKEDTVFNFIDHFPTIRQLIIPYWGYGASVAGPYDGMSFNIGIINIILISLALVFALLHWRKYTKSEKTIISWATISLIIAFFLMNYRSSFLWENLPFLPYFQFPWRLLIITTFISPIFLIALNKLKINPAVYIIIVLVLIGFNFSHFRPQDFLGRTDKYYLKKYTVKSPQVNKDEIWGYRISPAKADSLYLTQKEEYLRLPLNTTTRPWEPSYLIGEGNRTKAMELYWIKDVQKINDLYIRVTTDGKYENQLEYFKYLFPGWVGFIDNQPLKLIPSYPFGHITAKIPPGKHLVEIYFEETSFNKILDLISISGIIISILLWKYSTSTKS